MYIDTNKRLWSPKEPNQSINEHDEAQMSMSKSRMTMNAPKQTPLSTSECHTSTESVWVTSNGGKQGENRCIVVAGQEQAVGNTI